jgi:hypothetical protein
MHLSHRKKSVNPPEWNRARMDAYVSDLRTCSPFCGQNQGLREKSVDSGSILFYDLLICARGGDPGVSVALVYTAEILK